MSASMPRASLAQVGGLETLLMPGPVIADHAEYETTCASCHVRLRDTTQTQLCLDCHEEVAADVTAGTGYHGRIPNLATGECRACHKEHLGRDADVVQLDRDTFNHDATDRPLAGAHVGARCESCHVDGLAFREAPTQCYACHAEDDAHGGELGENCDSCHAETAWGDADFDHSTTDFPLVGSHVDVDCSSCHANQRYDGLPTNCAACHSLNDVHRGTRGSTCESCHTPNDWASVTFDHDRDTSFPLVGRHDQTACVACHVEDPYRVQLQTTCVTCHANDDDHRGRNGVQCADCHTTVAWQEVKFDHGTVTDFALVGSHSSLPCDACHRGPVYEVALEMECSACHIADDPHAGQVGNQCSRCHNEHGWVSNVLFDHDITRFPLLGLHGAVPCEECHLTPAFQDASTTCGDCHASDDSHAGALGPQCSQCHTPQGWLVYQFDHDTQTDFALTGVHDDLTCGACHRQRVEETSQISLGTACGDCHQEDDVHDGEFGRNCERCHTPDSFNQLKAQP